MTVTPYHAMSAKNVPHIATAAARAPFMRAPGTRYHTSQDDQPFFGNGGAIQPQTMRTHSVPPIHIDVDPMLEDAWEALGIAMKRQQRALEDAQVAVMRQAEEGMKRANSLSQEVGNVLQKSLARLPSIGSH
eukprot:jgi/Mesen1/2315/ME000155S01408